MVIKMGAENAESTEVSTESAETATETPETAPEAETEPEGDSETDEDAGDGKPAEYSPNTKFVVRNKEMDFDDWIKPVIKDAETEKRVRELYEKAHGIEHVKADRQRLRDTISERERIIESKEREIQEKYTPVVQQVQVMSHFLQNGNLDGFFQVAGIPKQNVMQWAVQYAQMAPEQRATLDSTSQQAVSALSQQFQQSQQATLYQQELSNYRERELDWTLEKPDVSPIKEAFDAKFGQYAFRNEVIKRGQFYAHQGRDISTQDAVNEVMQLVSHMAQPQQQQVPNQSTPTATGQVANTHTNQAAPQASPESKPVIPNIRGTGTSPAKKPIKSFAEMRRRSQEMRD